MKGLGLLMAGLVLLSAGRVSAQVESGGIRLFLDCSYQCDDEFIREQIPIVDFVRDRTEADIHLLVTTEGTASGGDVYSLAFLGRRQFEGVSDTLEVAVSGTDSGDEIRHEITKAIQLGLGPYLVRARLMGDVAITFGRSGPVEHASIESDPWNYWVFSVGANASLQGQATSNSIRGSGNMSANRITESLKIRLGLSGSFSEQNFDVGDETITSETQSGNLSALVVKSIGSQWAAGVKGSAGTSTYSNTDVSLSVGPALEYNIFPYTESTRRELRVQYGVQMDSYWYKEETIFNLTKEQLLKQYLSVSLDMKQPWGSITVSTTGTHLLTNFDRSLLDAYNISVFGGASVRIVRGLSFNMFANYSRIRDQLSLPLSEASDEEILLHSRRLPTGYDYYINFGLNYRFGSIFNNVINPRFGSSGGGGMIITMN